MYYARNLNIITPFTFKKNLIHIIFLLSSTEIGKVHSYAAVTDRLLQQCDKFKCPTNIDVINTIENNQKVGKIIRKINKEGSEVTISVCIYQS